MKIFSSETKTIVLGGKNLRRFKVDTEVKIIDQVSNFNCLGHIISYEEYGINAKLQRYNKMNRIMKCHFGKHMTKGTKLRIHNITSKAILCYGS
jgi:hypothetical protein